MLKSYTATKCIERQRKEKKTKRKRKLPLLITIHCQPTWHLRLMWKNERGRAVRGLTWLSIAHHLLSITHHPLSVVLHCCPSFAIHHLLFAIHHPSSTLHHLPSIVHCPLFVIHCPQSVVCSPLVHCPWSVVLHPSSIVCHSSSVVHPLVKWHGGGWQWWWCSRGGCDDGGCQEQKALFVDNMWCGKHPQTLLDLPISNSEGIPLPSLKGRGLCGVSTLTPTLQTLTLVPSVRRSSSLGCKKDWNQTEPNCKRLDNQLQLQGLSNNQKTEKKTGLSSCHVLDLTHAHCSLIVGLWIIKNGQELVEIWPKTFLYATQMYVPSVLARLIRTRL